MPNILFPVDVIILPVSHETYPMMRNITNKKEMTMHASSTENKTDTFYAPLPD